MKKVLCYGDSNTFGYNPADCSRFDEQTRWTALLQENLPDDYQVINEGMCDRTGFVNNDKGDMFSAQRHFPKVIEKIKNVHILILAVGTNDFQFKYDVSSEQIEKGLEKLILIAENHAKRIIIIPPVILDKTVLEGYFVCQFNETSILKSQNAGNIFEKLSKQFGLELFDFNKFVTPSKTDGLHYDENGHKIIADKLTEFIMNT